MFNPLHTFGILIFLRDSHGATYVTTFADLIGRLESWVGNTLFYLISINFNVRRA